MWRDAESGIQSELGDGERLLWSGKPRQGIVFRSFDVFLIPFSLVWTGFVVLAVVRALTSDAPLFPALCAVVFVLVGSYLLIGRFILDSKRRGKTSYGVTDERVMIISGLFSRRVESLNLRTLSHLSLSQKRHKSGTITFGPTHPMSWMCSSHALPLWCGMGHPGSAFEMIENAKDVYNLIRDAQQRA